MCYLPDLGAEQSKVLCLPRVNGLSTSTCLQPDPAYFIEQFMVGVQCLAQEHFSGGNFNVPVRGHELATFRYQDCSPNHSATTGEHIVLNRCRIGSISDRYRYRISIEIGSVLMLVDRYRIGSEKSGSRHP